LPDVRRKRVWARDFSELNAITDAGTAVQLSTDFETAMGTAHLPVGLTIGGIMLDFVASRVAAGADPESFLQIGVICTDEDTAAQVPRPLTDQHADWMWWQMIGFPAPGADSVTSTFQAMGGPLRVRSKRKCTELGTDLWLVAQASDAVGTYDFLVNASTLMLLP